MKKTAWVLGIVCAVLAWSSPARAQGSADAHGGVAFTFGVLGAGVDVAVPVGSRVNIRGGFSGLSFTHDFEDDGIDLAANLKLRSVSAHLDWFPFGGGFHISPGVMLYNGNEVTADARVASGRTFDLGAETLVSNPANPVTGTLGVVFTRTAPSLRIGWGNIVPRGGKRWSVPFELGVVFSQAPTASLSMAGSACDPSGTVCRDVATNADLQREVRAQEADINDTIDVLRVIPVLSLGFSFSF